jgi:CHAT domain-containing protein
MQRLPLANALVQGRTWASIIDTTVAPNAQCLLVAALQADPSPPIQPAVLGDAGSGTAFLPHVQREVEAVAALYGREPDHFVGRGAAASATASIRGLRSCANNHPASSESVVNLICNANIVHLACHGLVPEASDGMPRLELDGYLPIDLLEDRRLRRGAIVVLSACSAGGSLEEAPLELLGFPASLLSIGARNVIASTWPVPDSQETVDFMINIHGHLRSGLSAAASLGAATSHAVDEGVPYSVWGPFAVYGA